MHEKAGHAAISPKPRHYFSGRIIYFAYADYHFCLHIGVCLKREDGFVYGLQRPENGRLLSSFCLDAFLFVSNLLNTRWSAYGLKNSWNRSECLKAISFNYEVGFYLRKNWKLHRLPWRIYPNSNFGWIAKNRLIKTSDFKPDCNKTLDKYEANFNVVFLRRVLPYNNNHWI